MVSRWHQLLHNHSDFVAVVHPLGLAVGQHTVAGAGLPHLANCVPDLRVGAHVQDGLELAGEGGNSRVLAQRGRTHGEGGAPIVGPQARQLRLNLCPGLRRDLVVAESSGQDHKAIRDRVSRLPELGQRAALATRRRSSICCQFCE